eukprot:CAMPEP_0172718730 /NCGR_PEP_ID=MMETSP1074-20121228/75096_1 /TAXON_ID=2916 /ORGANISM="Ceratium fusus, Strain PA161109" /LENGTH=937 /DNA_ID=CAMNT_0013543999 /DNA_START=51 /DNA_END=2861 /DNA_ORIENTATION=-
MEPAAKKAKTDDGTGPQEAEQGKPSDEPHEQKEAEEPRELEEDAPAKKSKAIQNPVLFHTEDTTLNCMTSTFGKIMMPLTDGGLQYLLAGARANVGLKSGRYMFEAKLLEVLNPAEDSAARQRTSVPRNLLRVGVSTAGSSLFLGEAGDGIGFDMDGSLMYNKKAEQATPGFTTGDVVALLLNLDDTSPNANTVSLFKNGERASLPKELPEILRGKALFPTLTFKNVTISYNFGPTPIMPLRFTCRMVQDASVNDATASTSNESERSEVLFPTCLPDEGTFDWLDMFLEENPHYTELSDRAILSWAERSGLIRPKSKIEHANFLSGAAQELVGQRSSNDKPEMGFGIAMMDDGSVRRVLHAVAPLQRRNYVVMEVKSNLLKEERKDILSKWSASGFKRTAAVMMGEPPAALAARCQDLKLKAKQVVADAAFSAKKAEEQKKKIIEKQQREVERQRKRAEKAAKLAAAEKAHGQQGESEKKEGDEADEELKDSGDEEDETMKDQEEPPKVELTEEEKSRPFRKTPLPDLGAYILSTSFTKFSIPQQEEGFDEVRFDWSKGNDCQEYLKQWVRNRKLTTRIEDLQPSDWFSSKWKEWQKTLQAWHAKQSQHKQIMAKKAAEQQAKVAAKEAKNKAKEEAAAKEAKDKTVAEQQPVAQEEPKVEGENSEKKEGQEQSAEAGNANGEHKQEGEMAVEQKKLAEEDGEQDEPAVDFENLDVFGVENILDIGGSEPLFSAFGFEDWQMMSLRFELHLLAHAFRRDVNDPDRLGIPLEHLPFYYNKYFKKALNTKFYGVENPRELLEYVRDTVMAIGNNQVVEAQLPDDMESLGIFVMLTEESRRERMRRIDLGDDSARLKLSQPQVAVPSPVQGIRPGLPLVSAMRPAAAMVASALRPPIATQWQRPAAAATQAFSANGVLPGTFRPMATLAAAPARPFQPAW